MQFNSFYKQIFEQREIQLIDEFPFFNGTESFQITKLNCKNRVRYSGSLGNLNAIKDLMNILQQNQIKYQIDEFTKITEIGQVKFRNLEVTFNFNQNNKYIIVGAHHDTKYFPLYHKFEGANDGASGVGLIIGLILFLSKLNFSLPYNLKFILFDGQECFYEYSKNDGLFGSKHAAEKYKNKCKYIILADMIGSSSFNIQIPKNSNKELVFKTKEIVNELDYNKFFDFNSKSIITDDTTPFQKYQIPTINFIDMKYPYWHKEEDTIDKLSLTGYNIIGNVILSLIRKLCILN